MLLRPHSMPMVLSAIATEPSSPQGVHAVDALLPYGVPDVGVHGAHDRGAERTPRLPQVRDYLRVLVGARAAAPAYGYDVALPSL
jgi:hypothetical protein